MCKTGYTNGNGLFSFMSVLFENILLSRTASNMQHVMQQ